MLCDAGNVFIGVCLCVSQSVCLCICVFVGVETEKLLRLKFIRLDRNTYVLW